MRNFGLHNIYGADRAALALTTDALSEGQVLVRLKYRSFGGGPTGIESYVVVKITKTRLVVRHKNAPDNKDRHIRLIVKDGEVQTWAEGSGGRYGYDNAWDLATEDDVKVADARAHNNAEMLVGHVRQAAQALTVRGPLKREDVEAMLGAIQSWQIANPAPVTDED